MTRIYYEKSNYGVIPAVKRLDTTPFKPATNQSSSSLYPLGHTTHAHQEMYVIWKTLKCGYYGLPLWKKFTMKQYTARKM